MFKLSSRKRNVSSAAPARSSKPQASRNVSSDRVASLKASWMGNVDWGRARIKLVVSIFCMLWVGLWARAWYLQMMEGPRLAERARRQHTATELVTGRRGMIFDRNGQVLARSVEAKSVYARPQDISDYQAMANTLGPILGVEPQKLYDELAQTKRRFVWLKRKVDDYTAEAVRKALAVHEELVHVNVEWLEQAAAK